MSHTNTRQSKNSQFVTDRPPRRLRARAILEFGSDLSRPPIVYPAAGSDEMDEALRREILSRWNVAGIREGL